MGFLFLFVLMFFFSIPLLAVYSLFIPVRIWVDSIVLKRPIIWVEKASGEVYWTSLRISPSGKKTAFKNPCSDFSDVFKLNEDFTTTVGTYSVERAIWGYKNPPKED